VSGPHAFYRTGSRPLVVGGETIMRQPTGPMDWQSIRRTLRPTRPPQWRNGKLAAFDCYYDLKPYQVPYDVEPEVRPSKHRRGRMRSRTRTEQKRYGALYRRYVQMAKSQTVDAVRMRALHDELVTVEG
jgi:hypothetical protein